MSSLKRPLEEQSNASLNAPVVKRHQQQDFTSVMDVQMEEERVVTAAAAPVATAKPHPIIYSSMVSHCVPMFGDVGECGQASDGCI